MSLATIFAGWRRLRAVAHRSIGFRSQSDRMQMTGGLRLGLTRPAVALLCLFAGFAHAAPITVKDDAGNLLTLARPARRVVALAPSLVEMLYEAGGGNALVGAVEYSDFPPAARKLPSIGSNVRIDLERVSQLKPDLILVWLHGNANRETERLAALNIPMFHIEPHAIDDLPAALIRIGQLVGTEETARAAAARFRHRYDALRAQQASRTPVRVFYQVSDRPLLTINRQQIISDVIALCGGINLFADENLLVPQLSTESVVARRPEAILTAPMGGSGSGATRAMDEPTLRRWLDFKTLPAVRNRQLWLIPGDAISRHGPRILDGAEAVCQALDDARKSR